MELRTCHILQSMTSKTSKFSLRSAGQGALMKVESLPPCSSFSQLPKAAAQVGQVGDHREKGCASASSSAAVIRSPQYSPKTVQASQRERISSRAILAAQVPDGAPHSHITCYRLTWARQDEQKAIECVSRDKRLDCWLLLCRAQAAARVAAINLPRHGFVRGLCSHWD
eukprot:5341106-Amphidinium_carterae.2